MEPLSVTTNSQQPSSSNESSTDQLPSLLKMTEDKLEQLPSTDCQEDECPAEPNFSKADIELQPSSPKLTKLGAYNMDFLENCDDPNLDPFATKTTKMANSPPLGKQTMANSSPPVQQTLAYSPPPVQQTLAYSPPPVQLTLANSPPPVQQTLANSPPPVQQTPKPILSLQKAEAGCQSPTPNLMSPSSATPKTVKFCEDPPTKFSPVALLETTSEDRIEFLLNKIKSLKQATDAAAAAPLSQSDCSFSLPSNLDIPELPSSPKLSSPKKRLTSTASSMAMDYTMDTNFSMLDQDQSVLASQGGDL